MSHDEIAGLAAGFVLSALDPDEMELFSAHLPTCPECTDSVAELRILAGGLSITAEETEPPAGLRDRILAAAAAEPRVPPITSQRPETRAPWWRRPVLWPLPVAAVITALAVVVAVVAVWGSRTADDLSSVQRRLDITYDGLEIMGQAEHWWRFSGSGSASAASGSLAYSSATDTACLLVWGLQTGDETVYQARLTFADGTNSLHRMWRYDNEMWLILEGDPSRLKKMEITFSSGDTAPATGNPALFEVPLTSS